MLTQGIYQYVRLEEGGVANLKNDPGKLTRFGVTQATYDNFRDRKGLGRQSVLKLSEDETYSIYESFWNSAQTDLLEWPINIVHFTFAFNSGPVEAIKILQRALALDEDGIIGPKTKLSIVLANSDGNNRHLLALRLLLEQVFFYDSLDENDPRKTPFLTNLWLKRILHTLREIDRTEHRPTSKGAI